MHLKELKDLDLTSNFVFFKVMQKPELCRRLLEVILGVEIERIEYPENQKDMEAKYEAKGVRLDVYVKDGKETVYNVEMQTANPGNLPQRSRYYQGMIDINELGRGMDYRHLNRSYVIFICLTDLFGKGRPIYTFENRCIEDMETALGDGAIKIFLNPKAEMEGIRPELRNFLRFLRDGRAVDEFTGRLVEEVEAVKRNRLLEFEYKAFYANQQDLYEEALAEGKEEGKAEGLAEGMTKGKEEGLAEGILQTVKSLHGTREMAAEQLMAQCGMSREEAMERVGKYW